MSRTLNRRLAAQGRARQRDLLARADAVGRHAARAVGSVWQRFLAILRAGGGWHRVYAGALDALRALAGRVALALREGLWRLYHDGHRLAASWLLEVLPPPAVQRLLARRPTPPSPPPGLYLPADLLFPPPPAPVVLRYLDALVRPADWQALGPDHDKRIPEALARRTADLVSQGTSQRDVATALRPAFEGSRTRATRFARTIGLDVAHQAQLDADGGLGDLLTGYTVHAVIDEWTRPWHKARSGTTYYKHPGPGQLGFDRMPRPPRESPDPRDRPPKAPALSWNCRCWLEPILAV